MVSSSTGGVAWSSPIRISRQAPRNGVFAPTIAASTHGVTLTFYDFSRDKPDAGGLSLRFAEQRCRGVCTRRSDFGPARGLRQFDYSATTAGLPHFHFSDSSGLAGGQSSPLFASLFVAAGSGPGSTERPTSVWSIVAP
jgi:hypothetical protein